jgi:hypothetical protein
MSKEHAAGPDFAGEPEVCHDLSGVEVLQEGAAEKRKDAVSAWNAGLISKNEGRKMWSLPPVPGGDDFKAAAPGPFDLRGNQGIGHRGGASTLDEEAGQEGAAGYGQARERRRRGGQSGSRGDVTPVLLREPSRRG